MNAYDILYMHIKNIQGLAKSGGIVLSFRNFGCCSAASFAHSHSYIGCIIVRYYLVICLHNYFAAIYSIRGVCAHTL